jgi:dTDP-4-dehydrorhamnose reductase
VGRALFVAVDLRLDECESHPANSFAVNAMAVRDLGLVAIEINAAMVHFISDYGFDGQLGRPYTEEDPTTPACVFGVSKVAGEQLLRKVLPQHYVIQTSGCTGWWEPRQARQLCRNHAAFGGPERPRPCGKRPSHGAN